MGVLATIVNSETGDFNEIVQTVESHYGENKYCDQFSPSGDDAPPLKEDLVVLVDIEGTGNMASVGVFTKSQGAKPGEKIIYSRDANGNVVAKIHLKNDGSVDFEGKGDSTLNVSGNLKLVVKGNANLTVEGNTTLKAKGKLDITSDDDISISAGNGKKNIDFSAMKFSVNKTDFTVGI